MDPKPKPKFDPNKPFVSVTSSTDVEEVPTFDPNQEFTPVKKNGKPSVSPELEDGSKVPEYIEPGTDSQKPAERSEEPTPGKGVWSPFVDFLKTIKDIPEYAARTAFGTAVDQIPAEFKTEDLRNAKGTMEAAIIPQTSLNSSGFQSTVIDPSLKGEYGKWNNALRIDVRFKPDAEKAKMFLQEKFGKEYETKQQQFNKELVDYRLGLEKEIQQQHSEYAKKLGTAPQDVSEVTSGNVGKFIGNLAGQAIGRIPASVLTAGGASIIAERSAVFNEQIDQLANKFKIPREEVIRRGLDDPEAGRVLADFLALTDIASLGNVLSGTGKKALKKGIGVAIETGQEIFQGEGEAIGGTLGANTDYEFSGSRAITSGLGGLIGSSTISAILPGEKSAKEVVSESKNQVQSTTDLKGAEKAAEDIQAKVDQVPNEVVTQPVAAVPAPVVAKPTVDEQFKQPVDQPSVPVAEKKGEEVVSEPAKDDTHLIISSDAKTNLKSGRKKQILNVPEKGEAFVTEEDFTIEDANDELAYLEELAKRGKLTPEKFQSSYFGQATDTNTFKAASKRITEDQVGFIQNLKESFLREEDPTGPTLAAQELQKQITEAEDELASAATAFQNKAKELDKGLTEDQENLFGERKSAGGLFDVRADASQRETVLAPLKAKVEAVKTKLKDLREKAKAEEGKKDVTLFEEEPTKEKPATVVKPETKKASRERLLSEPPTSVRQAVLQYFGRDGKVNPDSLAEETGMGAQSRKGLRAVKGKIDAKKRQRMLSKDAPSIERLAEEIMDKLPPGMANDSDIRNEIIDVLMEHETPEAMLESLKAYDTEVDFDAMEQEYYAQVDAMSDEEVAQADLVISKFNGENDIFDVEESAAALENNEFDAFEGYVDEVNNEIQQVGTSETVSQGESEQGVEGVDQAQPRQETLPKEDVMRLTIDKSNKDTMVTVTDINETTGAPQQVRETAQAVVTRAKRRVKALDLLKDCLI